MADTKFDIKAESLKGLYAAAGAGDLAFETTKKYVAEQVTDVKTRVADLQKKVAGFEVPTVEDVTKDAKGLQAEIQAKVTELQKKVSSFEFDAKKIQGQATSLVNETIEALTKDIKELQGKLESLVADLTKDAKDLPAAVAKGQAKFEAFVADVKGYPTKAQSVVTAKVNETAAQANTQYADLAERGQKAVAALRKAEQKVVAEVVEVVEKAAPAKKAPAKRAAATKAPAKKAPAKKAAPKKA